MRYKRTLLTYILLFAIAIGALNLPARTRQAIDHKLTVIRMPLYVKACGFLYRDYMYKDLSRRITQGIDGDMNPALSKDNASERKGGVHKVMAIYSWTAENIKNQPEGFSVIDNHVWDIIIRRYGLPDQMADVFATLASYAGYEAFWLETGAKGYVILSFVRIKDEWRIFDVFNKRHFKVSGDFRSITPADPFYEDLLTKINKKVFSRRIRRPDKHKVLPRFIYELTKPFHR